MTNEAEPSSIGGDLGVSGRLVSPAAFKAVEAVYKHCLVGSIPIHSRCEMRRTVGWRRIRRSAELCGV